MMTCNKLHLMLQEKMPCESYQFTIQTLRVKCLRIIGSWKRNYTKNTPKNHDAHLAMWADLSEVWQISSSVLLSQIKGPQTDTTKMNQMYGIWNQSPWDTPISRFFLFVPKKTALAICASCVQHSMADIGARCVTRDWRNAVAWRLVAPVGWGSPTTNAGSPCYIPENQLGHDLKDVI